MPGEADFTAEEIAEFEELVKDARFERFKLWDGQREKSGPGNPPPRAKDNSDLSLATLTQIVEENESILDFLLTQKRARSNNPPPKDKNVRPSGSKNPLGFKVL